MSSRARNCWLAAGLVVTSACELGVDLEIQWLTWLSYREIEAIAPMPDGGLAIAGRSISDERRGRIGFGQSTFRPLVARLGADGAPVWTELGFLGEVHAVAAAEDATIYALTSAHEELDGHACDLVAYGPDGEVRWSRPMAVDDGCPRGLVVFDDRVMIDRRSALDVLDREGTPLSRLAMEEGATIDRIAASTHDLWALGTRGWGDDERLLAWHMSAGTSTLASVVSERSEGWGWSSAVAVREGGIDAVQLHHDLLGPVPWPADGVRLASIDVHGGTRRTFDLPLDASGSALLPDADGGWWLVGSTIASAPSLDNPDVQMPSATMGWRHLGSRGKAGPRVTRWFAEPAGDAADRVECISCDTGPDGVHGTQVTSATSRADGSFILVGSQHCRDAWVAAFEAR